VKVRPFSLENFAKALSNNYTDEAIIKNKRHYQYFTSYLGEHGLAAKTMVLEDKYVSKDFLHDYASYYAFCFEDYPKFCKRIHFFGQEFSKDQLQQCLLNTEESDLWDSYLGFIVIKPIPITVIGYTVLKFYSNGDNPDLRKFWGHREYKVHFFGKELRIASLAFQEQDSVLAACATTAIWSMLNKASADFHTILKVPSEITKDADKLSNDGSRLFPNKGLDILQICQAINNSGLAPEVRLGSYLTQDEEERDDLFIPNLHLKKIVNAYEFIGIPIILGIKVPTLDESGSDTYGHHAIAVSGHKTCDSDDAQNKESLWIANRINKLYVHDDQFGPFARVEFLGDVGIESPWTSVHRKNWATYVVSIIIPLYPKIRIPYEDIEVIVIGLNGILLRAFEYNLEGLLFWDIKLNYSEGFKKIVLGSDIEENKKLQLLEKSLPKYIWTATCYFSEKKFIEVTFDATDVGFGMLGKDVICYFDSEVQGHLRAYITEQKEELITLFQGAGGAQYIKFLLDNLNG
jgi:hypothetical protein